jgi:hypothetical protein
MSVIARPIALMMEASEAGGLAHHPLTHIIPEEGLDDR